MADPSLAALPSVRELAEAAAHSCADGASAPGDAGVPRWAIVEAARRAIATARDALRAGLAGAALPDAREVAAVARELARAPLRRVINATGVVLHTNLGRAPLAAAARAAVDDVARGYSNLEYDLVAGERGSRHAHLRPLLRELTGAEDGLVANNNAAATVLGIAALAGGGRDVIVSRGELVEIGGSFRLPEILAMSGARMVEVGTTNKTRLADYAAAITPATALLLKVHRSNFAIVGFTAEASLAELAELGRARGVATMIDLGSGALLDRATQRAYGLPDEPTVAEAVATGVDLVTFSGDKLLGGPQAGLAVGRSVAVAAARAHPLMRVVRPDKLALAALAATLSLYRAGRAREVPVAAMLGASAAELRARADALAVAIGATGGLVVAVEPCASAVGGGAMPAAELPSFAVTVAGAPADALATALRAAPTPVIARVEAGRVWLDVRTIAVDEVAEVAAAVAAVAAVAAGHRAT